MRKGFTLIELLVVIAITAILATPTTLWAEGAPPDGVEDAPTVGGVVDGVAGETPPPAPATPAQGGVPTTGDESVGGGAAPPTPASADDPREGERLPDEGRSTTTAPEMAPTPSPAAAPRTRVVRETRTVVRVPVLRTQREAGGPAHDWAKPAVEEALRRGQAGGGLAGRRPEATSSDHEWRRSVTREEQAVAQVASAKYAESTAVAAATEAVGNHDRDRRAHGLGWLWLAIAIVLAVAIGGYFFPRIRLPRPSYTP